MLAKKKHLFVTIISVILAFLLLASCSSNKTKEEQEVEEDYVINGSSLTGHAITVSSDGIFTLVYSPDESFNPYSSSNRFNLELSGLMYESLFTLDSSYNAQKTLCQSYTTDDGVHYTFTLLPNLKFSDGTNLTSADVIYSAGIARWSTKYSARFEKIYDVSAVDDRNISITLYSKNTLLPTLLDFPIVKEGTGEDDLPIGSGPYTYNGSNKMYANKNYRGYDSLPFYSINLFEYTDMATYVSSFMHGKLSMATYYDTNSQSPSFGSSAERFVCPTTNMQYLGFNNNNGFFETESFRRIFSKAINRDYIVENIMSGSCTVSSIPINPASDYFIDTIAYKYSYEDGAFSKALKAAHFRDTDADGLIDYPDPYEDIYWPFTLTFIVSNDDANKVEAARYIASIIEDANISVDLQILNWVDYKNALYYGEYDMYYGEVILPPDFDLTCILSAAGSASYGISSESTYYEYIQNYLAADTEEQRIEIATEMFDKIGYEAPFVPILFENYSVITHLGDFSGCTPVQSNIFNNITSWDFSTDK